MTCCTLQCVDTPERFEVVEPAAELAVDAESDSLPLEAFFFLPFSFGRLKQLFIEFLTSEIIAVCRKLI